MTDASDFVHRTQMAIRVPRRGRMTAVVPQRDGQLRERAEMLVKSGYGDYLLEILEREPEREFISLSPAMFNG